MLPNVLTIWTATRNVAKTIKNNKRNDNKMNFNNKPNKQIFDKNGVEHWVSRSISMLGLVYCLTDDEIYILATKRGSAVNYSNKWCLVCGYLDYNESILEGICREVYEETNLFIPPCNFTLWGIEDDPTKDERENITFRYYSKVDEDFYLESYINISRVCNNETLEVKWINYKDIALYDWAFNHFELLKEYKEAGKFI